MKFNLIADAGSTKTEWALLPPGEEPSVRFVTDGLNAMIADRKSVSEKFSAAAEKTGTALEKYGTGAEIGTIYYYGAGCATPEICSRIGDALLSAFGATSAQAESDLLGAARSLLGDEAGVACILGTGSNSCLYNGRQIVANVPSLGFILGDEGSGSALGRRLVNATFKGQLPAYLEKELTERHGLSLPEILDNVYRAPSPNRFLASLVPIIREHTGDPSIHSMVLDEFEAISRGTRVCALFRYHSQEEWRQISVTFSKRPQRRKAISLATLRLPPWKDSSLSIELIPQINHRHHESYKTTYPLSRKSRPSRRGRHSALHGHAATADNGRRILGP